jgi:hypothetical protein
LDISQSFEEKTVRMRIVVQVLEEIDWKSLYKKLGDLEGHIEDQPRSEDPSPAGHPSVS